MRKLASIQVVNGVYGIEGKDRIVQYGINGWKVIDAVAVDLNKIMGRAKVEAQFVE